VVARVAAYRGERAACAKSHDLTVGPHQALLTLKGHTKPLTGAALNTDGRRVLTFSRLDHSARLWDADSGRLIAVLPTGRSEILQAVSNSNGHRVHTLSNARIQLWNAGAAGCCLASTSTPIYGPSDERRSALMGEGLSRSVGPPPRAYGLAHGLRCNSELCGRDRVLRRTH